MTHRHHPAALALVACAAIAGPAPAASIAITGNNAWHAFAVDSLLAPIAQPRSWIDDSGELLAFTFSIGAGSSGTLTVVDAGFAGDVFAVRNFATLLGSTSAVPVGTFGASNNIGTDFDAALADPTFSRGTFLLGPGDYSIAGTLTQSVLLDGIALDATAGAVRLAIAAPIPEPSSLALMLAGLATAGAVARRRLQGAARRTS